MTAPRTSPKATSTAAPCLPSLRHPRPTPRRSTLYHLGSAPTLPHGGDLSSLPAFLSVTTFQPIITGRRPTLPRIASIVLSTVSRPASFHSDVGSTLPCQCRSRKRLYLLSPYRYFCCLNPKKVEKIALRLKSSGTTHAAPLHARW
nr:unnamed protein product [Digitaria exilis]